LRAIAHLSPLTSFLPLDKRLYFEPHRASSEKSCHAAAGQDFSLAILKVQALVLYPNDL